MNEKNNTFNTFTCCICLVEETQIIENKNTEITEKNNENKEKFKNKKIFEYNHCGKYYIHYDCIKRWKYNDCIICRKKLKKTERIKYNYPNNYQNVSQNNFNNDNLDSEYISLFIDGPSGPNGPTGPSGPTGPLQIILTQRQNCYKTIFYLYFCILGIYTMTKILE